MRRKWPQFASIRTHTQLKCINDKLTDRPLHSLEELYSEYIKQNAREENYGQQRKLSGIAKSTSETKDEEESSNGVKKIVPMGNFKLLKRTEGGARTQPTINYAPIDIKKPDPTVEFNADEKIKVYEKTRAKLFAPNGN